MSRYCHKCGYTRRDPDEGPENACPSCGGVYAKVEAELGIFNETNYPPQRNTGKMIDCPHCGKGISASANRCKHCGSDMKTKASPKPRGFHYFGLKPKNIIIGAIFLMILFAPGVNFEKYWAIAIGPIDARPSVSFLTSTDPEKRKEICSWTKREYLRNPSSAIKSVLEGVCKLEND